MRIAVVVSFLNEEAFLPVLLESMAKQTRPPQELLLVDDGSSDGSPAIAAAAAARHRHVRTVNRPPRPPVRDRLAQAAELAAFSWGVEQLSPNWDVVVKLDADLQLTPTCVADVERALKNDVRLGITGPYLSVAGPDGTQVRERCPDYHVRGPTKFYRRACWEQISPLPETLGWDTLDEIRARMAGWRTASLAVQSGDPIHLRPTSSHDGVLRGFRRTGTAAYGYGASPVLALAGGVSRLREPPLAVGGMSFLAGWLIAAARLHPTASPAERAFLRDEERRRLAAVIARYRPRPPH